jgi:phospholipase/carboxylesterase
MNHGILLHGRNRSSEEMLQLAARLNLPNICWKAPDAENGSWYPHRFMEAIASNEPFLSRAVERCDRLVREVTEEIALVGFSQGACLALEYLLRYPDRCGAVVAFTGGLIGPSGTNWKPSGTLVGKRVLITGSDIDEWVPEHRVRETASVLLSLGADVRLAIYKGRPHIVGDEEIEEARTFLRPLNRRSPWKGGE